MSAGHDEDILRCITNLCAHLDADLVNALLDDDQLLTDFQNDRQTLLASVVKAFRQLHTQLKEEISCAMSGHNYCGTFPIRLLSILEKEQQNKQNEEQPMSSADAEAPSSRKYWEIEEHIDTSQRNVLEFQFINAISICPVGREREGDFVDRSVQVESDLSLSSSLSASFSHAKLKTVDDSNFCSDATKKNEKNGEIFVESVSAASVYNGKESSFSTTTTMNSTNSTENSVGEIDKRNVTRLLATKSDIKLYSVDAEGALLTFTQKRKMQRKSAAPSTSTREKRGESHCFGRSPNSSSSAAVVTTPPSFCQSSVGSGEAINGYSAVLERNSEPIAPLTTNGRRHSHDDDLVEVLSAKTMAKGDGRRRSLAVREVSFHSSFDTTNLLNALVEERATGKNKESISEHWNRRENGAKDEKEEEGEQSTLDQVTPIPTTLELSNSI